MSDIIKRVQCVVTLVCCLHTASGGRSPDTGERQWFFDLPAERDTPAAWSELIPRIVYDVNVGLRRREPTDTAWIDCEKQTPAPLNAASILDWKAPTPPPFPWIARDANKIWEPAVCFVVDGQGRYDVMGAGDFSELLMYRLADDGKVTEPVFDDFIDRYAKKPGTGAKFWADRANRFKNLITIRTGTGAFRRAPDTKPFVSGPVRPEDL